MLRAIVILLTLPWFIATSVIAQPPRFRESVEPPLADGAVQQAGGPQNSAMPVSTNNPVVSIDIMAPTFVPNGKKIELRLRVVNLSTIEARDVVALYQLPADGKFDKGDLEPKAEGNLVTWQLGALPGGARKEIAFTVSPGPNMTEWNHIAKVRFEHGRQGKTKITRPEINVKVNGPSAVQQHDIVSLRLEVTNPGLMEIRDVTVTNNLAEGLVHQYDPLLAGQKPDAKNSPNLRTWSIPRLGPNQTQYIDYRVAAEKPGDHNQVLSLNASNGAKLDSTSKLVVQPPKLELNVEAPTSRGSHQLAGYKVTVRNAGNAILRNVTVTDTMPAGCNVISASEGGQLFDRDIQWILPQLQPNESRTLELTTKCNANGAARHMFAASYRSLKVQKEVATSYSDIVALDMDIKVEPPSVAVGDSVRMTLTVRNLGSAPATNVRPALVLPASLTFVSADPAGHQHAGGRIEFDPINVAANGQHTYTVTAKAVRVAIPAVISADLSATQLEAGPLRKQESVPISDPLRRQ